MDCLWLIAEAGPTSNVAESWMKGVVGIMLLFGVVALVGYIKKKFAKKA